MSHGITKHEAHNITNRQHFHRTTTYNYILVKH